MEFRKLIRFGKTSFVMSLPKSWVVKNKLKKGDLISLEERDDELYLSPKIEKGKIEPKEIVISIDGKNIDQIKREIIPAYINNNNKITIIGEELKDKAKEVRDVLQNLMALEIVEQTSTKIVAREFLNMEKISISNLIRRMDIITRDMISDSKDTFKEDKYENINHRDEDVNRLNYLIFRAIKFALENTEVARAYKLTPEKMYSILRITEYIEKIADEAKRIARFLRQAKITPQKEKQLIEIYEEIRKLYLDTMKAYHTDDSKLAYKTASKKIDLINKCDRYYNQNWQEKFIPNIIEKMKMMTVDIHNIGRVIYT
ncbi:phosphate uptake regulator PhoU [Candidatus Woesearchaeota archaeon]|nr:phosphate uptake regulator PhoU [Candidatus Woesearchaeota archaeon]